MAGPLHIDLFSTLDGVSQAPGGPDEDTEGGFRFGGWQAPLGSDEDGAQIMAGIRSMDALLLGRRTYDIFASYWPHQTDGPDAEIADIFNALPKYVASRSNPELRWNNSHLLGADLGVEIEKLRERHREIHVIGSIQFARSLLKENLFDQLNLWIYPIVLGSGKRLFDDGGPATQLELLAPPVSSTAGTVFLRYGPTGRIPATGDMTTQS